MDIYLMGIVCMIMGAKLEAHTQVPLEVWVENVGHNLFE